MKRSNKAPHRVCGALLFLMACVGASRAQLELALDLFREGDWPAARREALRAAASAPTNATPRLLALVCRLRETPAAAAAAPLAALEAFAATTPDSAARGMAQWEAARAHLARNESDQAWPLLRGAFLSSASEEVVLAAGAELLWMARREPARLADDDALRLQLASLRQALWRIPIESRALGDRRAWTGRPGEWVVHFYRRQISPALGHRCSLCPSCSEYFLQASRAHGWRGLPLIADRLAREPSVVQAAERPVRVGERTAYADPLQDHTFWWRKPPAEKP